MPEPYELLGDKKTRDNFPKEWQYDITDPRQAVRAWLIKNGRLGSLFNIPYQRMLDRAAAGMPAQFLGQLNQGGDEDFGSFVGKLLSGEIPYWNYQQAYSGLGDIADTMHRVNKEMTEYGGSPEANMTQWLQNPRSVYDKAVAGFVRDPKMTQDLYTGAFLPSLGPGLASGLAGVTGEQASIWDIIGPQYGQQQNTMWLTLLDYLLGRRGASEYP